jgi:ribosomal protein L29
MENRFKHKSMQLSDTSQIGKLRKDKARISTVINERKIIAQIENDEKDKQDGQ